MVELPKNEEELKALIASAVNSKVEELNAKHNNDMAGLRKSYEDKIKKTQDLANMSAEEKAKQLAEEEKAKLNDELAELRSFKKKTTLEAKLEKEGLPKYFSNDNRLLSAEDGDLDKVLKVVKEEYNVSLPKGNQHSTIVQTYSGQGTQGGAKDQKEVAYEKAGESLKDLFND